MSGCYPQPVENKERRIVGNGTSGRGESRNVTTDRRGELKSGHPPPVVVTTAVIRRSGLPSAPPRRRGGRIRALRYVELVQGKLLVTAESVVQFIRYFAELSGVGHLGGHQPSPTAADELPHSASVAQATPQPVDGGDGSTVEPAADAVMGTPEAGQAVGDGNALRRDRGVAQSEAEGHCGRPEAWLGLRMRGEWGKWWLGIYRSKSQASPPWSWPSVRWMAASIPWTWM